MDINIKGSSSLATILLALGIVILGGAVWYFGGQQTVQPTQDLGRVATSTHVASSSDYSIMVISPKSSSILEQGKTYQVQWKGGGSKVDIMLSDQSLKDVGASVSKVWSISGVQNVGTYSFTVPGSLQGDFQFYVSDNQGDYGYSGVFTVLSSQTNFSSWKTYTNPQYGFSIQYPPELSFSSDKSFGSPFIYVGTVGNLAIRILHKDVSFTSLSDFIQKKLAQDKIAAQDSATGVNFSLQSVNVGGQNGDAIVAQDNSAVGNVEVDAYLERGDLLYSFYYIYQLNSSNNGNSKIVEDMLSTFSFTK